LDGKRKQKYAKTQKEAREWLQKEQRALADGVIVANEKTTVGEFIDRWFEDVAKVSLRLTTIEAHETMIRVHIKPAIGSIRLTQLTPIHLQNLYSQKLKAGLSKRTVKYIHTLMHQSTGREAGRNSPRRSFVALICGLPGMRPAAWGGIGSDKRLH
jgi:hypothetical protein